MLDVLRRSMLKFAPMTPEQLIGHYGTRTEIATKAKVTETAVGLWVKQGWIPFDKQSFFEADSKKKLRASWMDLPAKKRPLHLQAT